MSKITYDSAVITDLSLSRCDYVGRGSTLSLESSSATAFTRIVNTLISPSSRVVWTLAVERNTTYNIQFQVSARIPNGEGLSALYAFAATDINSTSERNAAIIYKIGDASDNVGFLVGVNGVNTVAILATNSTPIGTTINAKIDVVKVYSSPRIT